METLAAFLAERFSEAGGSLSFEEFMRLALYDADHGYYGARIAGVGESRGDFATAATLSGGLGAAVAEWIAEESRRPGWNRLVAGRGSGRGRVPVIEIGAGSGQLAETVLRGLGWRGRRRVDYRIVEISLPLRDAQRRRLRGRRIAWHGSVEEALGAAGGRALIFSNELADAFPAKWLRWSAEGERWEEIWLRFSPERGLREEFRPLAPEWTAADFSALALPSPADGQRVEIQPALRDWLGGWVDAWTGGSMLTVDYGGSAETIYHRRPGGSLRAYFRNERIEGGGIYRRFGQQDLTVDVNFPDLRRWGEGFGFSTVALESQRDFFARYGLGEDAMAGEGAGEAFQVLWQRKGEFVSGHRKFWG